MRKFNRNKNNFQSSCFLLSTLTLADNKCLCRPSTIEEQLHKSEILITGKVIRVDTLKLFDEALPKDAYREMHLATVKTSKTYKGKINFDTSYIITGAGYSDCGYPFETNRSYLIYASKKRYLIIDSINYQTRERSVSTKDFYYTSVCDRTTTDIQKELNRLKVWQTRAEPKL